MDDRVVSTDVNLHECSPKVERLFPRELEFMTALRHANRYYKNDGSRVFISTSALV